MFGLEDYNDRLKEQVFDRFEEELKRSPGGWYETGILWKTGKHSIKVNNSSSIGQHQNLAKNDGRKILKSLHIMMTSFKSRFKKNCKKSTSDDTIYETLFI